MDVFSLVVSAILVAILAFVVWRIYRYWKGSGGDAAAKGGASFASPDRYDRV